jgi:hypothetical protein
MCSVVKSPETPPITIRTSDYVKNKLRCVLFPITQERDTTDTLSQVPVAKLNNFLQVSK